MTAMSTKRSFVSVRENAKEKGEHNVLALIALLAGALFLAVGIQIDSTFFAMVGFVGFTSGLLYLNAIFWSRVFKDYKVGSRRMSQIMKYY